MLRQRRRRFRCGTFICAKEHNSWHDAAINISQHRVLSTYYYI